MTGDDGLIHGGREDSSLFCPRRSAVPDGCGEKGPHKGCPYGGLGVGQQVGLGVQEKLGAIVRVMPERSDWGMGDSAAFWGEMFSTWRLAAAR